MARGKLLTIDEKIEKAKMELERLQAKKDADEIRKQVIDAVKKCDDAAKLAKALKVLSPQE